MRSLIVAATFLLAFAGAWAGEDTKPPAKDAALAAKEKELTQREAALAAKEKEVAEREAAVAAKDGKGPAKERVAFLGVSTVPAPEPVRSHVKLPKGVGLLIAQVVPDSPAAAAKVERDDVLVKLDDQLLVTPEQLAVLVRLHREGDQIRLTLMRQGQEQTVTVKLAGRDATPPPPGEWDLFGLPEFRGLEHFPHLRDMGRIFGDPNLDNEQKTDRINRLLGAAGLPFSVEIKDGGLSIISAPAGGQPGGVLPLKGAEAKQWMENYIQGLPEAERGAWRAHFQPYLDKLAGPAEAQGGLSLLPTPMGPMFIRVETEGVEATMPGAPAPPPAPLPAPAGDQPRGKTL